MVFAVLFLAVIAGFIMPTLVRKKRVFGMAVILTGGLLVTEAGFNFLWTYSRQMLMPVLSVEHTGNSDLIVLVAGWNAAMKVAVGVLILIAYWPGNKEHFENNTPA